jgi:putative hydrolase of the HAD superfamily
MPARKQKGVFFDAGDTLFEVKGGVGLVYSRFAGKYGVEADAAGLEKAFREVFKKSPPLAFPGAEASQIQALERAWWYDLVRSVFDEISFPHFDEFFNDVYLFFGEAEAWSLFSETREVLERLQKEGYYVGIISNFDSRIEAICSALDIRKFVAAITHSSRYGIAKPSPGIFRQALNEAGLNPSESIYVGDSPQHDIEGARLIGMTPLLVDRTGRYINETHLPRITDLRAVFDYL